MGAIMVFESKKSWGIIGRKTNVVTCGARDHFSIHFNI